MYREPIYEENIYKENNQTSCSKDSRMAERARRSGPHTASTNRPDQNSHEEKSPKKRLIFMVTFSLCDTMTETHETAAGSQL